MSNKKHAANMGLWQAPDINGVYEQNLTTEMLLLRKQRAKAVPTLIRTVRWQAWHRISVKQY
jgi:hypothetical protein